MGWIAAIGERGQEISQPEGPENFYGPILGAQWVRDNAGPDPVTDPGGGVRITAASNFQTAIDSNPSGSLFVVEAGETLNRTSTLNVGTKQPTIVMLAGSRLVGNAGNFAGIASTAGSGFTLRGGTIENFGNATIADPPTNRVAATPQAFGIQIRGPGIIEDVTITGCTQAVAFDVTGGPTTMRRCRLYNNYKDAVDAFAPALNSLTIEHCLVQNNNTSHFDDGHHAVWKLITGTSPTGTGGLVVRYNHVLDNYGFGIWMDFWRANSAAVQIYENVSENNRRCGIFYEGSWAAAIYRNYCLNNGTGKAGVTMEAGITVVCSDGSLGANTGIPVYQNDVDATVTTAFTNLPPAGRPQRGLFASWEHDAHPVNNKKLEVHHNRFWYRSPTVSLNDGQTGAFDGRAVKVLMAESTNSFHDNLHKVASLSPAYWSFDSPGGDGDPWTWAQWVGRWPTETQELI